MFRIEFESNTDPSSERPPQRNAKPVVPFPEEMQTTPKQSPSKYRAIPLKIQSSSCQQSRALSFINTAPHP